jgi:hypothetical protein
MRLTNSCVGGIGQANRFGKFGFVRRVSGVATNDVSLWTAKIVVPECSTRNGVVFAELDGRRQTTAAVMVRGRAGVKG